MTIPGLQTPLRRLHCRGLRVGADGVVGSTAGLTGVEWVGWFDGQHSYGKFNQQPYQVASIFYLLHMDVGWLKMIAVAVEFFLYFLLWNI